MEPARRTLVAAVLVGLLWGLGEILATGFAGDALSIATLPVLAAGTLGLLAGLLVAPWAGAGSSVALVTAAVVALPLSVWINDRFFTGVPWASLTNAALLLGCFVAGLAPGWLVARVARRLPAGAAATLIALALMALGGQRLATVLSAPAPDPWPDNRAEVGSRPNLLLITIDTLRFDHVGWAGYHRPTTPNLDALKAWRFLSAYAHAPWTTPSTATLLTGLHPSTHQTNDYADVLPDEATTLAEMLGDAGYINGYFTANFAVSSPTGLTRGADWIVSEMRLPVRRLLRSTPGRILTTLTGRLDRADRLNEHVFTFLESVKDRRFFAYVHYKDPHQPYDPPPPFDTMFDPDFEGRRILDPAIRSQWPISDRERENMIARYDGEIRFVDEQIGRLLEELKRRQVSSNTIVVVTSDHGEEFLDHGDWLHGQTVYEEMIRVPLLMRYPPLTTEAKDVPAVTMRQVDLAPTLLEMMDVEAPRTLQGTSFLTLLNGDFKAFFTTDRTVYAQGFRTGVASANIGGMKLIRKTDGDEVTYEMYELERDPEERKDLAPSKVGALLQARRLLEAWERQQTVKRMSIKRRALDEDQEQALRELGYIR